jgi:hypothetical protein
LYLFDGRYQPRPISYYNTPDWGRINWGAAYAVQVRDDYVNQRVYVAAPFDGATEATHRMVWDYSRGLTPEDVDFSLDDFDFGAFGGIGLIQDSTTLRKELWVGPAAPGSILRQNAAALTDNGVRIISTYRTGYVLSKSDRPKRLNRFGGLDFSVEGSGNLVVNVYGIDGWRSVQFNLPIITAPGESFERKFDLVDENVSVMFATQAINDWFEVESLSAYWKPFVTNR